MRQLTTFHFLVFVVQSVFTKYSAEQSTFYLLSSTGLPHSDHDKVPCVFPAFLTFSFSASKYNIYSITTPNKEIYTTPNIYSKPQSQMHQNLLQKLHCIIGLSSNSIKFPAFFTSGKMKIQIPCFPCAVATLINVPYTTEFAPLRSISISSFFKSLKHNITNSGTDDRKT